GAIDRHSGGSLARDCIALAAAVDRRDGQRHATHHGLEHLAEDAQGVAAAFIDVNTGVPALQAGDLDTPAFAGRGGAAGHFAARQGFEAARAADTKRPLFLAVEVQEVFGQQQAAGKLRCAGQAAFLVDGEEELQRSVSAILALHHGQRRGHADTVVGTQRSAVGLQPVAIADQANRIAVEVVGGPFVFLAHHVQVALQHGHRRALTPGARGLADHDVADTVRRGLQAQASGLRQNIIARRRLFFGGARDCRECLEMLPKGPGLQILHHRFHRGRPFIVQRGASIQMLRCWVFVQGLKCLFCETAYPVRVGFTCPRCGIAGILDVQYDYAGVARILTRRRLAARSEQSHWRYRELLPIGNSATLPALFVGGTPLTPVPALARHLGIAKLFLKDDGRNATGSLKDRASSVGVVKSREKRRSIIACASTGNAASSCAGMAASMGLKSVIFVPERAPEPKVTQLLIFGATVLRVRGSYEDAFQLSQSSCERWGWYNRNSAINPYLVEGKKTVGLEICEQLGWQVPDWVAVSVGDGCTIAAVWKAFHEMKTLGLTERTPKMLGVQAAGAAPITTAFRSGETLKPIEPQTIADSIAVGVPRNWKKAVLAIQASGGIMINVEDEEILEAMRRVGRLTGIFAEPAAATAIAGVRRALEDGTVGGKQSVLAVITGNGLKDIRSAQSAVTTPFDIDPDGAGLEQILKERNLIL